MFQMLLQRSTDELRNHRKGNSHLKRVWVGLMVRLNSEDRFFKKREQKKRNFSLIKDQGELRKWENSIKSVMVNGMSSR